MEHTAYSLQWAIGVPVAIFVGFMFLRWIYEDSTKKKPTAPLRRLDDHEEKISN